MEGTPGKRKRELWVQESLLGILPSRPSSAATCSAEALHAATEEEVGKQLGLQKWGQRRRVFRKLQQIAAIPTATLLPVTSLPLWMMYNTAGSHAAPERASVQPAATTERPRDEAQQAEVRPAANAMQPSNTQLEVDAGTEASVKDVPATPAAAVQPADGAATAAEVEATPAQANQHQAGLEGTALDEPMPDAAEPGQQTEPSAEQQETSGQQRAVQEAQAVTQQQQPVPQTPAATVAAGIAQDQKGKGADGAGPSTAAKSALTPQAGLVTPAIKPEEVVVEDDDDEQQQQGGQGGDGGPAQLPEARRLAQEERDIKRQMEAEGVCVGKCRWVAKQLIKALTNHKGWAPSKAVEQARMAEALTLGEKCALPGCSVVVVGNTGAGKSTLLNAVIGEQNALPTNGMRACTAVLVELSYAEVEGYVGEVEFLSRQEWERELDDTLEVLTQQDGRAILNVSDPEAHNYQAWCKLWAVYGETYTLSRERYGEYENGRAQYRPITVQQLKAKLLGARHPTRYLGTTQVIRQKDVNVFRRQMERFVDSSNAESTGEGALWPMVRMVRMKSAKWEALRTGARLVDAPGVRDDNQARDAVVKRFLKEADTIWVVSHISRAVNDKTAKDLMGEGFRRQLLMDGQMSNLVFIATQSDNLVKSEIAFNLRLPPNTPKPEVAAKRNAFTKARLQDDFLDGLEEMTRAAGDWHPGTRASLAARFKLPVFTVSAMDFQKLAGVRTRDGPPQVWSEAESTEVPQLRRLLHSQTLERRRVNIRRQVEALIQFSTGIKASLELSLARDQQGGDGQAGGLSRAKAEARTAVEAAARALKEELAQCITRFRASVDAAFKEAIGPQLQEGARAATQEVLATVKGWGAGWSRSGAPGAGLHWCTYKAQCRRDGEWKFNWNEILAEPVYRAVSTFWERMFTGTLQAELDKAYKIGAAALVRFALTVANALGAPDAAAAAQAMLVPLGGAAAALGGPLGGAGGVKQEGGVKREAAGGSSSRAAGPSGSQAAPSSCAAGGSGTGAGAGVGSAPGLLAPQLRGVQDAALLQGLGKLAVGVAGAKDQANKQQRDINRMLPPEIKAQMTPAYQAGNNEAGPGSHARRKAHIENHVDRIRGTMFASAIEPMTEGLTQLLGEVASKVAAGMTAAAAEVQLSYGVLWAEAQADGDSKRAQEALLPRINVCRQEARRALMDLLRSQGVEIPAELQGEVEEDEDLQVIGDGGEAQGGGHHGNGGAYGSDDDEDDSEDEEEAEFFRKAEAARAAAHGGAAGPSGLGGGAAGGGRPLKPPLANRRVDATDDVIELD